MLKLRVMAQNAQLYEKSCQPKHQLSRSLGIGEVGVRTMQNAVAARSQTEFNGTCDDSLFE